MGDDGVVLSSIAATAAVAAAAALPDDDVEALDKRLLNRFIKFKDPNRFFPCRFDEAVSCAVPSSNVVVVLLVALESPLALSIRSEGS